MLYKNSKIQQSKILLLKKNDELSNNNKKYFQDLISSKNIKRNYEIRDWISD